MGQPQDRPNDITLPRHPWPAGFELCRRLIPLYKIVRPLSRVDETLSGVVYLVRTTGDIEHELVVKVINPKFVSNLQAQEDPLSAREAGEEAERRMKIEAEALSAIRSDFVVRFHDYISADESNVGPALVMEYMRGVTLAEYLRVRVHEPMHLLKIAGALARGLADVHRAGFLHLDLKPGNVMMSHEGEYPEVKIIDFSIGRRLGSELRTRFHAGSVGFVAPEANGVHRGVLTEAADVYALGKIMGGLFVSRFHDEDLDLLPPAVRELVRRAISPEPTARPSSAWLAGALKQLADTRSAASPEKSPPPPPPVRGPRVALLGLSAIAGMMICLVVVPRIIWHRAAVSDELAVEGGPGRSSRDPLAVEGPPLADQAVSSPLAAIPGDLPPREPPETPVDPGVAESGDARPATELGPAVRPIRCPKSLITCVNQSCAELLNYPLSVGSTKVRITDKDFLRVARESIEDIDGCLERARRCHKHVTNFTCKTEFGHKITKG
ncbi:serine/threonine protein kinase [Nannocystis pusilla]|uniref:serine/threonine protein kinase n=1 Tax=Nannocystis pusilla TaxID=889268 RepID=UPI003BF1E5FE